MHEQQVADYSEAQQIWRMLTTGFEPGFVMLAAQAESNRMVAVQHVRLQPVGQTMLGYSIPG
jgi:hypothetical protein